MRIAIVLAVLVACASAQEPSRGINHVTGDLYQVYDENNTFTAFLVTPEGIILTDPISTSTATWLKAELLSRFEVPVTYLIYSHSHDDHSSGAAVYDDAILVGHENVVAEFEIWNDLSIEIDEFDGFDGSVEALDAFRRVNPAYSPDITFTDRMTIKLGGKQVDLLYLGKGHSDNLIAVRFPEERAVLAIDLLWVGRVAYLDLPYRHYFPDLLDGLRLVESLDFDTVLVGHGRPGTGQGATGTKENVIEFRKYFEALYDKIVEAKRDGLNKGEAVATIELPDFRHLGMYDQWFKMNVEGMYRHMTSSEQERR